MAAKSRGDFNIARAWFWFSAIAATIYATVQLMPLEMTLAWRVFLVALAWALIGACLTYGLAWGRSERARGRNVKADRCRETFVRRDKAHIHDEDPRQLLSLYQGRTALQGDKLIQPYKGTWIEFQGVLDHVTPEADSSLALFRADGASLDCRFGHDWDAAMQRLDKGDVAKVRGKISDYQGSSQLSLILTNGRGTERIGITRLSRPG
jgi:hypothetical protein